MAILIFASSVLTLFAAAQPLVAPGAQPVPAKGLLRVHPENPRYFTDGSRGADDLDSSKTPCAIRLGAGDSSVPTKGNVFGGFRIERNRIYRSPKAELNEQFRGYVWYNCWADEDRLNHSVVRGNRLFTEAGAKPLLAIQRENQSIGLIVQDNAVQPYTNPPTRTDMITPRTD